MRLRFSLLAAAVVLCSLSANAAASLSREAELLAAARALTPWLSDLRRSLHETPELGFDLPLTHKKVSAVLKKLGVEHRRARGKAKDGIVATIGNSKSTKSTNGGKSSSSLDLVYALRADMDALPILEESAYPSHSKHKGVMHACGHDAHMTMLLGAARLLKERESRLAPPAPPNSTLTAAVRLLFQPAEEGGAGGKVMADEGELEGVNAGLSGLHVWPALSAGKVSSRPGTLMAAAGRWEVEIKGRGGHGAMPHLSRDPVVAGAAVVMALQTLVAREVRPTAGGVVTVARFNSGEGASNVIPDSVRLAGTVRALTSEAFETLRGRVDEVVAGVAGTHRCEGTVEWEAQPYGPTSNDAGAELALSRVVAGLGRGEGEGGGGGPARKSSRKTPASSEVSYERALEPTMAAEDFGFLASAAPNAVFAFLGTGDDRKGTGHGLHTSRFLMDDEQLAVGAAIHAAMALDGLERAAAAAAAAASGGGAPSSASSGLRDEL